MTTLADATELPPRQDLPPRLQMLPIQAMPTVEPLSQALIRDHAAFSSLNWLLHSENRLSRLEMSAFDEQGRFQAVVVEPVDGQDESLMVRFRMAREMLKASSYTCE